MQGSLPTQPGHGSLHRSPCVVDQVEGLDNNFWRTFPVTWPPGIATLCYIVVLFIISRTWEYSDSDSDSALLSSSETEFLDGLVFGKSWLALPYLMLYELFFST